MLTYADVCSPAVHVLYETCESDEAQDTLAQLHALPAELCRQAMGVGESNFEGYSSSQILRVTVRALWSSNIA